jgi:hypothetical protein
VSWSALTVRHHLPLLVPYYYMRGGPSHTRGELTVVIGLLASQRFCSVSHRMPWPLWQNGRSKTRVPWVACPGYSCSSSPSQLLCHRQTNRTGQMRVCVRVLRPQAPGRLGARLGLGSRVSLGQWCGMAPFAASARLVAIPLFRAGTVSTAPGTLNHATTSGGARPIQAEAATVDLRGCQARSIREVSDDQHSLGRRHLQGRGVQRQLGWMPRSTGRPGRWSASAWHLGACRHVPCLDPMLICPSYSMLRSYSSAQAERRGKGVGGEGGCVGGVHTPGAADPAGGASRYSHCSAWNRATEAPAGPLARAECRAA